MYQFYYSDNSKINNMPEYNENINNQFEVTAIRPAMWEEHCLECSAPLCFENCVHYEARSDGRCKRFCNGIFTYNNDLACCKKAARIKFRKWANMMTIIYPAMYEVSDYCKLTEKNEKLGKKLKKISDSRLPVKIKWETIRTLEFLRRKKLKSIIGESNESDAFVFHGYSFEEKPFNLIIDIFNDHTSVFKLSIPMHYGENIKIISDENLSDVCNKSGFLVKVYPENDIEAEIEILWCDFVKGRKIVSEKPAEKVKCVVWDLDNTIWDGTLIETENPDSLSLRPFVSETIKELDKRGIIQSIASKNDFDPAWNRLNTLGISEYFIYPQIHWNSKSGSVKQIAKSLNIGIDTFALIDDSAFERNQVASALPQVRTYDVTEIEKLCEKPEFDVPITEESKNRRSMYKAEEKRNIIMKSDNSDTVEFLKKCNLSIEVFKPVTQEEKLRCYELLVRTNQLNLSGKKYTEEEFKSVLNRENHKNFAFSCKDDFGSYGIVGFGQYKIENGNMVFTEFAMSCRVAGKFIESALFAFLLNAESCSNGIFAVNKTKKNVLLRNALQLIGFKSESENEKRIDYSFDSLLKNKELVKVYER